MKTLLTSISQLGILVLSISLGFAQISEVNDKLKELEGDITEEDRIAVHIRLAQLYSSSDSVEMMSHLIKAQEVADRIEKKETEVDIIFVVARYYALRKMHDKVELQCQIALDKSRAMSYKKGEAVAYSRVAASLLYRGFMDTATILFNKAIEGHKSVDDKQGLDFSYHNLGNLYYINGNFDLARNYYKKALKLKEELGQSRNSIFIMIGNSLFEQGLYVQALNYFFDAADGLEKMNDKRYLSEVFNSIGATFKVQNDLNESLKYYNKSLKIREELEYTHGIAASLNNIAGVYTSLEEYEKAEEYYNKSLAIFKEMSDPIWAANCLSQLGGLYSRTGQIEKAISTQNEVLRLHRSNGEQPKIASTLLEIAYLSLKQNEISKAAKLIDEALTIAEEILLLDDLKRGYLLLAEVESKKGSYEKAYAAHLKHKQYADSLLNQENTKAITRMEADYEFQQERDSISFAQEKVELEYEKEIERGQVINQAAIGGGALVLVILILLYRSYLIKQKNNTELRHKNDLIESKNEELTSKNEEITSLRETEKKMAEESLALKERELTNVTMLSHEKNELLQQIGDQIGKIGDKVDDRIIPDLKEIKQTIKSNISAETWNSFTYHFEQVHPEFFNKLKARYDDLNQNDLRLCAYIKVGLNNKVIAQMGNVTLAAVKKNINRLKKKMDIGPDDSLRDFMMEFI